MILIDHVLPSGTSRSGHDQRSQGAVRDAQAGLDALLGATPDRVLVLDREHDVEPALVERVDDPGPVDLPEARYPVPPPADIPRVGPLHRPGARPPAPPPTSHPGGRPPPPPARASRSGCAAPERPRCPWPGRARRGRRTGAGPRPGRCPSTPGVTGRS